MQNISDYKCDICGRITDKQIYHVEERLLLCLNCSSQLHTCRGCAVRADCEKEKNPLGIQPIIVQTIRQGNATIQQQIPNPELTKTYCVKCICHMECSNEIVCMREACGNCCNWKLHKEYEKKETE